VGRASRSTEYSNVARGLQRPPCRKLQRQPAKLQSGLAPPSLSGRVCLGRMRPSFLETTGPRSTAPKQAWCLLSTLPYPTGRRMCSLLCSPRGHGIHKDTMVIWKLCVQRYSVLRTVSPMYYVLGRQPSQDLSANTSQSLVVAPTSEPPA
jgi:hypothetical protein